MSGKTTTGVLSLSVLVVAILLGATSAAYAFPEPSTMGGASCAACHDMHGSSIFVDAAGDCATCHAYSNAYGYSFTEPAGPHGNYSTTTRKCAVCHSVHNAAAGSILLLPAATIVDTCFTCHDGTAGWGVYGTILARTGRDPATDATLGSHRVGTTSVIPGGDSTTGGDSTRVFSDADGLLICTDCHSVHGSDVVAPFSGERMRIRGTGTDAQPPDIHPDNPVTSKLLRRTPTGASTATDEYGSEWCLGCHEGRASDGVVHNHPVETTYVYNALPILDSSSVTWGTVIGGLGDADPTQPNALDGLHVSPTFDYGNRGYLMPYPRTSGATGQDGHYPICQQCHEDSRDVGDLAADGSADVVSFNVGFADGVVWDIGTSTWIPSTADNPRFQNFPHETENDRMVIETNDDLCLNCHPSAQLP